jgi:hypothetical protein
MDKQELYIDNNLIQLTDDVAVSLNYAITDIAEPDKVKGDFSKTIKIPGSAKINKIFNHLYDTRIDLDGSAATFDPNVKLAARYSVNSIELIDGFVKLNDVVIKDQNCVEYHITLFGKNVNLFSDIGEAYLEDIDLSKYDHDWTLANEADSWATRIEINSVYTAFALGVGYVYPMIDYGFNNDEDVFDTTHLFPAVYAREYLLNIFTDAGYSWNSTFLDSTYFKSLIVPYNGLAMRLSETQVDDRTVIVQDASANTVVVTTTPATANTTFDTEVQDNDGQITVPSTTITVGESGYYNLLGEQNYTSTFADSSGGAVNSMVYIKAINRILVNGTPITQKNIYITPDGSWTGTYTTATNPTPSNDEYWSDVDGIGTLLTNNSQNPASVTITQQPYYYLTAGDTVTMDTFYLLGYLAPYAGSLSFTVGTDIFDDNATPGTYYSGTVRLTIEAVDLRMIPVPSDIVEGNTIDMNNVIPKNIKQKDFLKGIIQKHNLYIQPQRNNPLVLDIEPRDDFYTTGAANIVNWSTKLDTNNDILIKPLGALKFREFKFKDKPDQDHYNKQYESTHNEVYGQRDYVLANEYLKGTKVIETVFSPTPLVGDSAHDRIISEIFNTDNNLNKTRLDHNIRLLYYGGLLSTGQSWTHTSSLVTDVVRVDYAYAGHLDEPYSPTVDLNWGLTKEVFYDGTHATVNGTINNCSNAYWYNYINEISNINSKEVIAYFNLNATDISELDFKKLYYFNGDYFRLQRVFDYNPIGCNLTKCQFIKFKENTAFVDATFVINGGEGVITGGISDVPFPSSKSGGYIDNNVR